MTKRNPPETEERRDIHVQEFFSRGEPAEPLEREMSR